MKKSKSSAKWLADHESDEFVKRARKEGYRSRAVYKLLEIDQKYQLLKEGLTIVDLGAAPGGWSQIAAQRTGPTGFVVGLDILPIEPLPGVQFIQADFTEDSAVSGLREILGERKVDLVISDMAPNLSGMKEIDQPRAMYLVELALEFSIEMLRPGGSLLTKCFEGADIDTFRSNIRSNFKQLSNVKPRASRGRSREVYLLGRGFKGC